MDNIFLPFLLERPNASNLWCLLSSSSLDLPCNTIHAHHLLPPHNHIKIHFMLNFFMIIKSQNQNYFSIFIS